MAKSDFVSFRPGDLTAELLKRGNDSDMSATAKALLRTTFETLQAETFRLQGVFSLAEMQTIFCAPFDTTGEPEHAISRLCGAIDSELGFTAAVLQRYRVDKSALLMKIRALSPIAHFAIVDGLKQFRRIPYSESLGLNAFPSKQVLQRLGFMATEEPAAWGFCVIVLADYSSNEFVLRRDPSTLNLSEWPSSVDEMVLKAVEFARLNIKGQIDNDNDIMGFELCYRLAQKTGWRHFRIKESKDGNSAAIEPIPRQDLMHDFQDGSLEGLNLAGVNAPEKIPKNSQRSRKVSGRKKNAVSRS